MADVFYNILNVVGRTNNDSNVQELAATVKNMQQTK